MKKTMWGQRLPALLLALVLCLSLLPAAALADDGDFTIENGVLIKYNGPGGAVVIPDGVTVLRANTFGACNALTRILLPVNITFSSNTVFNGITPLDIYYRGTQAQWDAKSNHPLTTYTLHVNHTGPLP